MARIEFNAEKHEYRLDGVVIPSVTTIISAVGLYDFDHVSRETLAVAAERGIIVHQCIEWYERGTLEISSIDPELRGYFNGYLSAKASEALPFDADQIEQIVWSERYRYAGTLDQLYGGDWINDIKTGAPGAEHGLQLSAYWLALHPDMKEKPRRLTCTYLTSGGGYSVVDYPYEPLAWLAVLADYRWREVNNKIKPKWR